MVKADYVIVGSGLTGAVIARLLADQSREVIVLDRRSHMGGNVHDHLHESGIRVHTYGPHYFRTSSEEMWNFARRFSDFYPYEARVMSLVDGSYENWPLGASYIRRRVGENWQPEFSGTPRNFEEAALSLMPRTVYELFVKEYNEKQWGVPATELMASLCRRFDVRADDDPRLKPQTKFQGLPAAGYAQWMSNMLAGIPIVLNCDFMKKRESIQARKVLVFTGPIDEFFGYSLGKLKYRGQKRTHQYLPDVDWALPNAQVNNPIHSGGPHIRTLEWKHMMDEPWKGRARGTVLTQEVPFTPIVPDDYEYPFPDQGNQTLYKRYREQADACRNVIICGRLGEYRYYDMDQAIARAFMVGRNILAGGYG